MLEINGLQVEVGGRLLFQIDKLQLNGGVYLLTGENGCGKSTLFKSIYNGQGNATYNQVIIDESDRNQYIALLSQDNNLLKELTSIENLQLICPEYSTEKFELYTSELNCKQLFESDKRFEKLSGGEKQKVKLVISLLLDTDLLLLDEVDNNLDSPSIEGLIRILSAISKLVIVITHNHDFYSSISNGNLVVNNGKLEVTIFDCGYSMNTSQILNKSKSDFKLLNKYYQNLLLALVVVFTVVGTIAFNRSGAILTMFSETGDKTSDFGEVSSVITSPITSPLYDMFGDSSWLTDTPYLLSDDFIKQINSLDYVTKVQTEPLLTKNTNSSMYYQGESMYSLVDTDYHIDDNLIPSSVKEYIDSNQIIYPSTVTVQFTSQLYTTELQTKTPYKSQFELLFGNYPDANSNQIMIPINFAIYLTSINKVSNLEQLIDQPIEFNFIQLNADGTNSNKTKKFKFEISGIYTTYGGDDEIITSYNQTSGIEKKNDCSLYTDDVKRKSCLYLTQATFGYSFNQFEQMAKDNKLGTTGTLYVEVTSPENLKDLSAFVNSYDPFIFIENNYTREHNGAAVYRSNKLVKYSLQIGIFYVVALVITILLLLINSNKNREVDQFIEYFGLKGGEYMKYRKGLLVKRYLAVIIATILVALVNIQFVFEGIYLVYCLLLAINAVVGIAIVKLYDLFKEGRHAIKSQVNN